MTPAARLGAAIDILTQWAGSDTPADRLIDDWGRRHRFAGSKDRAAIAERVYAIFRRRREIETQMGRSDPRAWVLGSLRVIDGLAAEQAAELCGGRFAPDPLSDDEIGRIAAPVVAVDANLPDWLVGPAHGSFGTRFDAEMAAMGARATADLRVNRLRAGVDEVVERLARQDIATKPGRWSPDCLHLDKARRLDGMDLFLDGWVEAQDEGSQLAALLVDARPGMRVLDLCAGAGGKSLALAAIMDNQGEITADDSDARRLDRLGPRAYRAGAKIIRIARPTGLYDRVLIDAPCSGSGTWRRSPDARWRLSPDKLAGYLRAQASLLARAADAVRPGGRLVYVTCSWLIAENSDQVATFLSARPDFFAVDAAGIWHSVIGDARPCPTSAAAGPSLTLSTDEHGTDGFFISVMERRS